MAAKQPVFRPERGSAKRGDCHEGDQKEACGGCGSPPGEEVVDAVKRKQEETS
ncbi:hypothetical protein HMPREF1546_03412 [Oscillibacter sp. KLE 1745]|jgi:hypothetical protein|nr:hypothetical protein HMPREF1546_03412 [Oscillibacter sp. KLE 1745]